MTEQPFSSALGKRLGDFLHEKHACGYRYRREADVLRSFDRHLVLTQHSTQALPSTAIDGWLQPHQSPRTQMFYLGVVSELARFLRRQGLKAQVPDRARLARVRSTFVPRVFTTQEICRLLAAVDGLGPDARSPHRGVVFSAVFRILYTSGLRAGEVLRLSVGDVDMNAGVLTVRQGKFRKDRLVPIADQLLRYLRGYAAVVGNRQSAEFFFQSPRGRQYSNGGLHCTFRLALRRAGIPHGGRGRGPRVHDLRHTFAVHRLEAWYRQGADLSAKLPVLARYMGHTTLAGTQRYLRLTAAVYPDVTAQLEARYGELLPRRGAR